MNEITVSLESIRIVGRHRSDLGDVEMLAKSIADIGLINPITITPASVLIAGERRIAAARLLGWLNIQARVVDNLEDAVDRLHAERDENTCRKAMTPSELVALAEALEEIERPRAAERKANGQRRGAAVVNQGQSASCSPEQEAPDHATTREIVARAVGMSPTTYNRAKQVVAAARDPVLPEEDREVARLAMAEMDATGRVAGAYEKVVKVRAKTLGAPQQTVIETAAQQRKAISVADTAMSGICHGLRQIAVLHPDITCEEAARWMDGLSKSRQVIESLIKQLRERTNART